MPSPHSGGYSQAATTKVTSPPATHIVYLPTLTIDPDPVDRPGLPELPELPELPAAPPLPLLVTPDPLEPEDPELPEDVPLPPEETPEDPDEPPDDEPELPEEPPDDDEPELPDEPPDDEPELPDEPPEEAPDEPPEKPPEEPPPEEPPPEEPLPEEPPDELGRSRMGLKSISRLVKTSMVGIVRADMRPHEVKSSRSTVWGRMITRANVVSGIAFFGWISLGSHVLKELINLQGKRMVPA